MNNLVKSHEMTKLTKRNDKIQHKFVKKHGHHCLTSSLLVDAVEVVATFRGKISVGET